MNNSYTIMFACNIISNLRRPISRAVIHKKHFTSTVNLIKDTFTTIEEVILHVINRNNKTQFHSFGFLQTSIYLQSLY